MLPPACGGVAPPLHLPHPRWSWPLTSCCPSTVCHRVPSRACAPRVAKSCCVTRFRTLQGRRQARERMLACPRAGLSSPQRRQVGGVSTTLCAHASRRGTHTHAHAYALVRKRARTCARTLRTRRRQAQMPTFERGMPIRSLDGEQGRERLLRPGARRFVLRASAAPNSWSRELCRLPDSCQRHRACPARACGGLLTSGN